MRMFLERCCCCFARPGQDGRPGFDGSSQAAWRSGPRFYHSKGLFRARSTGNVGLAVVNVIRAIPGMLHFNVDGVKLAIQQGWHKSETVLTSNKLCDFGVCAVKIIRVLREVSVATRSQGKLMQPLIGQIGRASCRETV